MDVLTKSSASMSTISVGAGEGGFGTASAQESERGRIGKVSLLGKGWLKLGVDISARSSTPGVGVATEICECFLLRGDCEPDGFRLGEADCSLKLPELTAPMQVCELEAERVA